MTVEKAIEIAKASAWHGDTREVARQLSNSARRLADEVDRLQNRQFVLVSNPPGGLLEVFGPLEDENDAKSWADTNLTVHYTVQPILPF